MRRAYKYRLYPTKTQATELGQQLETLRRVYNAALAERKDCWELYGASTHVNDQKKRWRTRRKLDVQATDGPRYLARVAAHAVRDTLTRLDRAFQSFFRRVKEGGNPGYPRFRGIGRFDSIPFDNYGSGCHLRAVAGRSVKGDMPDDAPLKGHRLDVFGVGRVKVKLHRPVKGRIKTVTIKREADRWYVVFSCDLGDVQVTPSTNPAVGVDVGLEHFLTTSDGDRVANPRFLQGELPKLRRSQRASSRKYKRGCKKSGQSKRWKKSLRRVAKLHARVKNLRRENAYRIANDLVKKYGTVCVESLNVLGMLKNGKLARHIADAGWSGFVGVLKHVASKAGVRVVEVNPSGTSQLCSGCGGTVAKDLRVRTHACPHCGLTLHRDHNAARNILARGLGTEATPRTGEAGHNAGGARRVPRSPTLTRQSRPRVATPKPIVCKVPTPDRSRKPSQMTLWDDDGNPTVAQTGG